MRQNLNHGFYAVSLPWFDPMVAPETNSFPYLVLVTRHVRDLHIMRSRAHILVLLPGEDVDT